MPPFKNGLLKRKIQSQETKNTNSQNDVMVASGSEENENLIRGEFNLENDATDSEHEDESDNNSEAEQDTVLYDDGTDSTFGDEELYEDPSDESSELTDSEAESDTDENEENKQKNSSVEESGDSGAESGSGQVQSGSSDESEKQTFKLTKQPLKTINKVRESEKTKNSIEILADKIKQTSVNIQPVEQKDEYESGDSSDEEERRNTVGDVPSWWYREYPHVGYDLDGRRIMKPPHRDHIDDFLKKCEDPDFWRTVRDPATGQDVVLSKSDLELIARIRENRVPNPEHEEYQPWVEWFTREVLAAPVRAFPEHKRSFLPSRDEQRHVARLVHALNMGWAKTRRQLADERRRRREKNFYNLWGSTNNEDEEKLRGIHKHIPAPKRPLPGHAESYNPPPEYLLDAKEMKEWNKLSETPWKRKYTFLPTRHASLRAVPAYARFTRERFLRCLDLYLAPRALRMRLTVGARDLLPALPAPRDLRPFPTAEALRLAGHAGLVRSCDFDPSGQYVVSAGDDATVRVWETQTGRCVRTLRVGGACSRVAWAPAGGLSLVAAACGARLLLLNPAAGVAAHRAAARTDRLLRDAPPAHDVVMDERTSAAVRWEPVSPEQWARGVRLALAHFKQLTHVSWHGRGDYVATTVAEGGARAVLVHQLSRRRSQLPFARAKGLVQCAHFHPIKPLLFVATQRVVRIYDLVKQELVKKLLTGAQWISAMAVHPAGDNLLVASYDRKCMWFDLDLSSKPYQTLRLHGGAVRAVAFHKRYPLFASAGDDHSIIVSHGMVYNDLLQNPLLVPLKQLRGPEKREDLCVLDIRFHPTQPWLLAAGADGTLRLYT